MSTDPKSEITVEGSLDSDAVLSSQKEEFQGDITEDEEPSVVNTESKKLIAEDSDDTLTDNETPVPNQDRITPLETSLSSSVAATAAADLLLDESIEELHCQWKNCDTALDTPKQLYFHILESHISDLELKCLWQNCEKELKNHLSLITHIRKHAKYEPYICTVIDCTSSFTNPNDLLNHQKQEHPSESTDLVPWIAYVNEFENYNQYLSKRSSDNSGITTKKYSKLGTSKQFENLLDRAQKIDFIKIQNVSVEDIVSEPIKKKGRTANSEINVQLRSTFKERNEKFKNLISTESKKSFNHLKQSHIKPLEQNTEIDSITSKEELQSVYEYLNRQLLWGLEVNELMTKDFEQLKKEENIIRNDKEVLLDASIKLEISSDNSNLYNENEL